MSRRRPRRPATTPGPGAVTPREVPAAKPWRRELAIAAAVGALALTLRLLFLLATPDAGWPGSAAFAGDAELFLDHARAVDAGRTVDLGLPLRPPGTVALIRILGTLGVTSALGLKVAWCLLGALTVALATTLARRALGPSRGTVTGIVLAGSTGLLLLATSLCAETPYLLLAVGLVGLWQLELERDAPPRAFLAGLAGVLHALALLVRVDHLIFAALHGAWLLARSARARTLVAPLTLGATAVLVLLPWHLDAWARTRAFNRSGVPLSVADRQAHEELDGALWFVEWTEPALRELEQIPPVARRDARSFVTATVAWRGGERVEASDLTVINEAFGSRASPLPERFLVALYGPLNLARANRPGGPGGWDRALLEEPPPLAGGAARYPPLLTAGLPPVELSFSYPPHVALVVHGDRIALRAVREQPLAMLRLVARKAARFWTGASLGVGGWNLPLGLTGTRQPVDVVVPDRSPIVDSWRLGLLVLTVLGIWRARDQALLMPWIALLAARLAPALLVFGYARFGATAIPAVVILATVAATPRAGSPSPRRWIPLAVATALLAAEGARWTLAPRPWLDGSAIATTPEPRLPTVEARRLEIHGVGG